MVWRSDDPEGDEAGKVKYDIVRYTRGAVLDFGCGPNKAFPRFIGVDSTKDTELFGVQTKPDVVCALDDPEAIAATFHPESVDAIFSSHLLEHIEDTVGTLKAWWSLIKVGGHLVLYLPHAELYPRIGTPGSNPDHKHDFRPADIVSIMADVGSWDLKVCEERNGGREYSFLLVFEKHENVPNGLGGHFHTFDYSHANPRPEKTACIVRHGGIGDQIQAAHLLPELKRQGYHITVLTTVKGRAVIEHDPHIDDWYMVDVDQVPNHELGNFWHALSKRYDKFINLNESVEGVFLALPGRIQHTWPQAMRHKRMNENYAEFAAELAGIPFVPEGRFYATREETLWALDWLHAHAAAALGNGPVFTIMWTLSGSSPHKFTPHQDTVIEMILQRLKRAVVILTGDVACKILEAGWEQRKRVICTSGELDVRQTLTLAQECDLVIGPETGVLNAVAYEPMPKVALLSHSSPENLTKHWTNTVAIEGKSDCYPCHMLHFDRTFCPYDPESGAALCQVNVSPTTIYHPIDAAYVQWMKVQMLRESVPA